MDFYRYIALIAAFALAVTLFISPFLRNSPNSRPETCKSAHGKCVTYERCKAYAAKNVLGR